jgi:hypothetical protein
MPSLSLDDILNIGKEIEKTLNLSEEQSLSYAQMNKIYNEQDKYPPIKTLYEKYKKNQSLNEFNLKSVQHKICDIFRLSYLDNAEPLLKDPNVIWSKKGGVDYRSNIFYLWGFHPDDALGWMERNPEGKLVLVIDQPVGVYNSFPADITEKQAEDYLSILANSVLNFYSKKDRNRTIGLKIRDNVIFRYNGIYGWELVTIYKNKTWPVLNGVWFNSGVIKEKYAPYINKVIEGMSRDTSKRFFVMGVPSDIKETIINSIQAVSKSTTGLDYRDFHVIDGEELREHSKLRDLLRFSDNKPILVVTAQNNQAKIFSWLKRNVEIDDLLLRFGGYFLSVLIPHLCKNCKVKVGDAFYNEVMINLSIEVPIAYERGHGCSCCVDGYSDMLFLLDYTPVDTNLATIIKTNLINSVNGAIIPKDQISPVKIAMEIYESSHLKSLKTEFKKVILEGKIAVPQKTTILS